MPDFKVGDIVRLLSGSNKMTVTGTSVDSIEVAWYNFQECKLYRESFPSICLVHCPDKNSF